MRLVAFHPTRSLECELPLCRPRRAKLSACSDAIAPGRRTARPRIPRARRARTARQKPSSLGPPPRRPRGGPRPNAARPSATAASRSPDRGPRPRPGAPRTRPGQNGIKLGACSDAVAPGRRTARPRITRARRARTARPMTSRPAPPPRRARGALRPSAVRLSAAGTSRSPGPGLGPGLRLGLGPGLVRRRRGLRRGRSGRAPTAPAGTRR